MRRATKRKRMVQASVMRAPEKPATVAEVVAKLKKLSDAFIVGFQRWIDKTNKLLAIPVDRGIADEQKTHTTT